MANLWNSKSCNFKFNLKFFHPVFTIARYSSSKSYNVLFFGSSEFAIPSLKRLIGLNLVKNLEVVTSPDSPRSNHHIVPVKLFAKKEGLVIHDAPQKTLRGWNRPTLSPDDFDLAVVVSFGYFLPKSLIRSFKYNALNVHPSLLPKYRGSAPIEHTLLNGDKETGVSIIELDETRFDAGRILNQTVSKVDPETDFLKLHNSLADIGAELLIETIKDLDKFKVEAKDQDETLVTRAPKISKDMASIDWNTMNSDQILRMFNALSYRYPPYTHFNNNQVQLLQISSALPDDEFAKSKLNSERPSGTMIFDKKTNHLYIKCRDDWIQCTKLKVQNKNAVPPKDFANGYNLKDGDYFVIQ